jgi:hypothetical protein
MKSTGVSLFHPGVDGPHPSCANIPSCRHAWKRSALLSTHPFRQGFAAELVHFVFCNTAVSRSGVRSPRPTAAGCASCTER